LAEDKVIIEIKSVENLIMYITSKSCISETFREKTWASGNFNSAEIRRVFLERSITYKCISPQIRIARKARRLGGVSLRKSPGNNLRFQAIVLN